MKYIGIDIGVFGAIAVIENDKVLDMIKMPVLLTTANRKEYDTMKIVEFFQKYLDSTVILEKTQALPKIGSVQIHQLGKGFGIMIGILSTLRIRYFVVHPKTWQTKLFRDCPGDDTKTKSIIISQRLFPNVDFKRSEKSKKTDHNFCDAVLLAFYAQKYL